MNRKNSLLFEIVVSLLLVCLFSLPSCASDDPMGGGAANKASGGDAAGRAGAVKTKLVGNGYMSGDSFAPDVNAERNTTASTAGPTYSIGTVAASGGTEAMQRAIATDLIVAEIKGRIDAENALPPEQLSADRLALLRAELSKRVKEIADQAGRASPQITISGNTMLVIAPSATGTAPPLTTEADVKAAGEIQGIIDALLRAKSATPQSTPEPPSAPPTSRPIEPATLPPSN